MRSDLKETKKRKKKGEKNLFEIYMGNTFHPLFNLKFLLLSLSSKFNKVSQTIIHCSQMNKMKDKSSVFYDFPFRLSSQYILPNF